MRCGEVSGHVQTPWDGWRRPLPGIYFSCAAAVELRVCARYGQGLEIHVSTSGSVYDTFDRSEECLLHLQVRAEGALDTRGETSTFRTARHHAAPRRYGQTSAGMHWTLLGPGWPRGSTLAASLQSAGPCAEQRRKAMQRPSTINSHTAEVSEDSDSQDSDRLLPACPLSKPCCRAKPPRHWGSGRFAGRGERSRSQVQVR